MTKRNNVRIFGKDSFRPGNGQKVMVHKSNGNDEKVQKALSVVAGSFSYLVVEDDVYDAVMCRSLNSCPL